MHSNGTYSELEYFVLSLVADGCSSGYAIRKSMSNMKGGRWSAESGSVYRVLRRLERDGLVEESGRAGVPNRERTEYAVSERGKVALHDWLVLEPDVTEFAYLVDPIRTRAYFLDRLSLEEQVSTVRCWLQASKAFLADCESTRLVIETRHGPSRARAYLNLIELAEARHDWLKHLLAGLKDEQRAEAERLLADR